MFEAFEAEIKRVCEDMKRQHDSVANPSRLGLVSEET